MRNIVVKARGRLSGSSVFAIVAASVIAAGPARSQDIGVAEIVVTAQKRTQALSDVPISVSVVGGETLKEGGIRNLSDLSARLSGVTVRESGNNDILSIRGVNSGTNSGFEQSVATFVDGAYRGRARSMRANLFDVERVEVLRGPQSTFFGNSAIAGAFNITTKKAKVGEAMTGDVSALYEPRHGEYDVRGALSFPLGETLAGRIALGYGGMDGWVKNDLTGRDEPNRKDLIGRVSLAWEPTDKLRTDFRVDAARLRTDGTWSTELTDCPPDPAFGIAARGPCAAYLAAHGAAADTTANYHTVKPDSFGNLDVFEAALTNQLSLGEYALTSTTTYFKHDFDQAYFIIPVDVPSPAGSSSWFQLLTGETLKQFTQEVRLQSPESKPIRWTLGGYYLHSKLDSYLYASPSFLPFGAFAPPALGFNARTILVGRALDRRKDNLLSAFGAVSADLGSRVRVNLGLRYSHTSKIGHRGLVSGTATTDPLTRASFLPGTPAQQGFINGTLGFQATDFPDNKRTESAFLPSAGFEFDVTEDVLFYGSYSKGEKAGGWSVGTAGNEFDEESVDAYEIGLKGDFFDRRLFLSIAAFRSNYKNLQESANSVLPNGSFVVLVANAARSRSQGIELTANARVNEWVSLNFDGAYLESKYISFPNATCNSVQAALQPVNCVQSLAGRQRYYSPKWSGSVGATVRIPLSDGYAAKIQPLVAYRSTYNLLATLDPVAVQKGYATLDTRLSVAPADGRWEVALVGKNLTDKKAALIKNVLVGSPGSSTTTLDRPRTVALQAIARF